MTSVALTVDGPFYVGDQATLLIQWSDPLQPGVQGDPATDPNTGYKLVIPTTVSCKIRDPSGAEQSLTVIPPAQGAYLYKAITPTFGAPGPWWFGWDAAGSYVAHKEGVLQVRQKRS